MPTEWWQDFFSGLSQEVQRRNRQQLATEAEAAGIQRLLALPPGSRILDVPCGEGRLGMEFAAQGYRVTGVDVAPSLLERAREASRTRCLEVDWVCADMRDLRWEADFDAVVCYGSSFGFFDEAGNRSFLAGAYRALKPGGRFILETDVVETMLPTFFPERGWTRLGDVLILDEHTWNHELSRFNVNWTFVRGNVIEERHMSVRIYTFREVTELLNAIGFVHWQSYATPRFRPFALGARMLVLAATK